MKGGLRAANIDGGEQKHVHTRDEQIMRGLRTANTDGEDKSTHCLVMGIQRGV